jgi:hypothetical protein
MNSEMMLILSLMLLFFSGFWLGLEVGFRHRPHPRRPRMQLEINIGPITEQESIRETQSH